ncbi:Starch-binding associating with outer membrane [Mariniphaga anaerophila]|uniref:Starch-binding associating with outer membrane n=1 Tax=Mariniphaga anaerophila TaxID=1484053 RepID=A0A1M5ESA2_9BACT|nr:SusD/RagB family nutrient-binding outer membrane lipoprotein [Mariniphaga anaerophila]SHF82135.1 Starch-binding associating with outer membrane [Mariniphaga anaerophila]
MMKKIFRIFQILFIGLVLFVGCTDDFDEMNTNPNAATEIDPSLLFPKLEREATNGGWANYQMGENLHTNLFVQWMSNSASYFSSGRYEYNNNWVTTAYWTPYYTYVLKNLLDIKKMAEATPKYEEMYHIARIATAIGTARTTDLFGDIPYSEASRGTEKPIYDAQKDIYYSILKDLKEATEALSSSFSVEQMKYGNQDIIYGGDVAKWIKLGNSLRLRYALRLSFVDPEKAKAEGEAALNGPLLSSVDDNAALATSTDDNDGIGHPLYTLCYWNEFRMSSTLEKAYKELSSVNDPRMECYWGVTESTHGSEAPEFKGVRNGLPTDQLTKAGNTPAENSNIWGLLWAPEWNSGTGTPSGFRAYPYYTMCFSEVCFLKAEAAIRGWNNAGDARTNYEDGIRASFKEARHNVNTSLYETTNDESYIAGGSVKWDEAADFENKLERVITQKWIALFPNGNEAWAEFRRTGYPELTPIAQSDDPNIKPNNGEFLKKLRYVNKEREENTVNATSASLNGGKGDGSNVRVWWDTERYK